MDKLEAYITAVFLSKKYKSAIEFGCTYGSLTVMLNRFCQTIGVDIAPTYVNKARKCFPFIKFIVGNCLTYRPKKKFDVAVTHGLLIHVPPADIKKAIKNILKVAKEALLVESSGIETAGIYKEKYSAKRYWEHRAKHPAQGDDLKMKYYYSHDYEKLFDEMGINYQVVYVFDVATNTRMYHLWQK